MVVRTAIVLAGERPGGNALARAHNATSSLLLDLNGRAVMDWTLSALTQSQIERIVLVGPGQENADHPVVASWVEKAAVQQLQPATGPAASAVRGAQADEGWPKLLTAADHALLTPADINEFCSAAGAIAGAQGADLVVGLVDHALVHDAFPESKRTLLKFADGSCCGSNLFLLANPGSAAALQVWSELEAARKQPWKIAWGIGLGVCLRYLLGRLTVADAFAALSRRTGVSVSFCKLAQPALAVDVDSVADLALASQVLTARASTNRDTSNAHTLPV